MAIEHKFRSTAEVRTIDLFCGAGGLTEGFKRSGYDIRFAVDSNKDAWETYRLNHPDIVADQAAMKITDLTPAEILDRAGGRVDVALGGPSCQGFSTANRQSARDEDERNHLWSHMLAIVRFCKPQAFLLENVPGLVYWEQNKFGEKILAGFRRAGYTVRFEILLAANYGLPQLRRRLFMIGLRDRVAFEFPLPTHMGSSRRDSREQWEQERRKLRLLRHISSWEAIGDLPALGSGTGGNDFICPRPKMVSPYARRLRSKSNVLHDHEATPLPDEHLELIRHVPAGGTWRDIPGYLLPERFFGMRRTDSSNLFGRLDPALPAYTVTTQFENPTVGCNIHPYEDRVLTVREGARLQSFQDDYKFHGSLSSRCVQIGNAVPPLLAEVLAGALARQLGVDAATPKTLVRPGTIPPPPKDPVTGKKIQIRNPIDSKPSALLRRRLHSLRIRRFRTAVKPIPNMDRAVDVVFPTAKVAVFVHECFWHGCDAHKAATLSKTYWWKDGIENNVRAFDRAARQLRARRWTVIRLWEHQAPDEQVAQVLAALKIRAPELVRGVVKSELKSAGDRIAATMNERPTAADRQ